MAHEPLHCTQVKKLQQQESMDMLSVELRHSQDVHHRRSEGNKELQMQQQSFRCLASSQKPIMESGDDQLQSHQATCDMYSMDEELLSAGEFGDLPLFCTVRQDANPSFTTRLLALQAVVVGCGGDPALGCPAAACAVWTLYSQAANTAIWQVRSAAVPASWCAAAHVFPAHGTDICH